ncbi:hypothetical protein K3172_08650 [Qipengyuania sp. 6B39]|uniref:hypothetical protein n=1 Tax=Qipengyuania proteolytica TaxID=2867239 RepID=UPI001C8A3257|nr:hypothetical protein [Qipengyuania proteolytica]MBX7495921.1 hypothetical protein [Qipengyuania proteolytica]
MGKSIASRFENIDIAKSVLLGVIINDDELTLEMDFCLDPAHPAYETPGTGEENCYHPGMLKFAGISKLSLDRPEGGVDGKKRFAISEFSIEGSRFDMSSEWGDIHLQARSIRVLTE